MKSRVSKTSFCKIKYLLTVSLSFECGELTDPATWRQVMKQAVDSHPKK